MILTNNAKNNTIITSYQNKFGKINKLLHHILLWLCLCVCTLIAIAAFNNKNNNDKILQLNKFTEERATNAIYGEQFIIFKNGTAQGTLHEGDVKQYNFDTIFDVFPINISSINKGFWLFNSASNITIIDKLKGQITKIISKFNEAQFLNKDSNFVANGKVDVVFYKNEQSTHLKCNLFELKNNNILLQNTGGGDELCLLSFTNSEGFVNLTSQNFRGNVANNVFYSKDKTFVDSVFTNENKLTKKLYGTFNGGFVINKYLAEGKDGDGGYILQSQLTNLYYLSQVAPKSNLYDKANLVGDSVVTISHGQNNGLDAYIIKNAKIFYEKADGTKINSTSDFAEYVNIEPQKKHFFRIISDAVINFHQQKQDGKEQNIKMVSGGIKYDSNANTATFTDRVFMDGAIKSGSFYADGLKYYLSKGFISMFSKNDLELAKYQNNRESNIYKIYTLFDEDKFNVFDSYLKNAMFLDVNAAKQIAQNNNNNDDFESIIKSVVFQGEANKNKDIPADSSKRQKIRINVNNNN